MVNGSGSTAPSIQNSYTSTTLNYSSVVRVSQTCSFPSSPPPPHTTMWREAVLATLVLRVESHVGATTCTTGLGSITLINYNYNYNYTIEFGFNYNYNYIFFALKFQLQLQLRHTYKCQLQLQL